MYTISTLHAIEAAEAALANIAEHFAREAQSTNATSSRARRAAALRVRAIEALEALATIDADDIADPVDWTPTPDDVLALDAMPPITGGAPEPFEPTQADWEDYAAWSGSLGDGPITDQDHQAVHGCV